MMTNTHNRFASGMLFCIALAAGGWAAEPPPRDPAATWRTIQPFFQPPAEFAGKFGPYRSPLLFNDGSPVRSAEEWPRRRTELLEMWQGLMGPWPAVVEKPKIEVLAKSRRENFTQLRVR